jgi:two-component system, cell cycle sensor histidine kinase and response regulator CckA
VHLYPPGIAVVRIVAWVSQWSRTKTEWALVVLLATTAFGVAVGYIAHRMRAQSLLGAVFAAAANAIIVTDRNGEIQWVNLAFSKLSGYTADEVIGQTPRLLRSGEHNAEFYERIWSTILSGNVWNGEVINRHKNGSLYAEEMTITPIRFGNRKDLYFVAVKQDITKRKSLEDQLRQSQKLESVGRLSGGIAHDFNNLLGVIMGYVEMLDSQIGDDTTLTAITEEIRNAVSSAAALTSQLLAFGRKQLLRPQVVDLNHVVSETVKMLRRVVGEDIVLHLDLAPDAGNVEVDPSQLQQVIMNLAVNARDAMPKGGNLTITTETKESTCDCADTHDFDQTNRYVTLALSDTGLGMDEETRRQAFEPFFTTKGLGHGTGLGLSTVCGIVKQSGGHVCLSSELGKGTVAKIHLVKIDKKATNITGPTSPKANQPGSETILLVEDYGSLRKIVRSALETNGYLVLTAESGAEAIDIVKSYTGPIHLLVTDVIMPEIDGPQLASRITELHREIRVLFMSGYTDEMLGQYGVVSSDLLFIKKPFELPDFLAKIREALESTPAEIRRPDSPAA